MSATYKELWQRYQSYEALITAQQAEIERLRADKTAISQTASDYLHKIEKLEALLKPFLDTAKSEGIVT